MLAARLILILFLIPFFTHASVVINEIMYDIEGSDSGREWVEIYNSGSEAVDLIGWKFFEANTNHALTLTKGEAIIQPNSFAIIADNQEKFLIDWSNFSGTIFDSSFSLSNTGETLTIRNSDLIDVDSVSYISEWGAVGDGKSLQKINNNWIANNPTPGTQNANSQSNASDLTTVVEPGESESTTVVGWPVEPQIFANAGSDKTTIAGADVKFSGQAFGLQKEPLEGARCLWNFGDGSTKEGQSIFYSYQYPGDYIAVLDVSSGKFSASDRALIKVLPNELKIIEANNNYIKLHNGSGVDLDISFWFLKSGSQSFKFPENTFIKSNSDLSISSSVSKIISIIQGQEAELLYPNNSVASQFIQQETAPQDSGQEIIKHSESNNNDSNEEQNMENMELAQAAQAAQIAGAINLGDDESPWGIKEWLMIIGGIIVISISGLLFIRRQSPS